MKLGYIRDELIENSGIVRRIYGLKLLLLTGINDESKWFLLDRERLKYKTKFMDYGLVLDFGAYKGNFTSKLSKRNPHMSFQVYEPVSNFYDECVRRFKNKENIEVFQFGVTSDGRDLDLIVDGPRTKVGNSTEKQVFSTKSIVDIFADLNKVELVKMNIEGMEYECLYTLIRSGYIKKVNYLLIQFHNFRAQDTGDYRNLIEMLDKDFKSIFQYPWKWELWKLKTP